MWLIWQKKMVNKTSILALLGASIGNASLVPLGNQICIQICPWKSLLCIINWKWKWLSCAQLFGTLGLRILEWVAYPFSSGSSWPRNQTGVSCIAGGFFTSWTTSTSGRWHLSSVGIKGVWVKGKRKCVMQDIQQFIAPPVPYAAVLRDRITASKTPLRKREGSTQLLPHSSLDSQLSKNYGDALL